MNYEQHVSKMIQEATKSKDRTRLQALRSILAALIEERTKSGGDLSEERAIQAISRYRKKMLGAAEQYRDVNRVDLAESAESELAVCDELLPKQLSDEEIGQIADEIISENNATSPKDMGAVMGPVMKRVAGRADGNRVKSIVLAKLGA